MIAMPIKILTTSFKTIIEIMSISKNFNSSYLSKISSHNKHPATMNKYFIIMPVFFFGISTFFPSYSKYFLSYILLHSLMYLNFDIFIIYFVLSNSCYTMHSKTFHYQRVWIYPRPSKAFNISCLFSYFILLLPSPTK